MLLPGMMCGHCIVHPMGSTGGSFWQLIVVLLRILVAPSIFRWPLTGALASMLIDALDAVLIEVIGFGGIDNFAALDKGLDMYYLSFELIVSLRWEPLAKWTSVALFAYRAVGVVVFEVTQTRAFLLVFPNLFENFYLAYLLLLRFAPRWTLTAPRLGALLVVLLIPKLAQEYLLHYAEAQPWDLGDDAHPPRCLAVLRVRTELARRRPA